MSFSRSCTLIKKNYLFIHKKREGFLALCCSLFLITYHSFKYFKNNQKWSKIIIKVLRENETVGFFLVVFMKFKCVVILQNKKKKKIIPFNSIKEMGCAFFSDSLILKNWKSKNVPTKNIKISKICIEKINMTHPDRKLQIIVCSSFENSKIHLE